MRGETFFSLSLFRFPSAGFSPPSLLLPLSSLSLRFPKRHEKKYTKEKKRFLPFLFLTYPPSKGSSLERGTKAERKRRGGGNNSFLLAACEPSEVRVSGATSAAAVREGPGRDGDRRAAPRRFAGLQLMGGKEPGWLALGRGEGGRSMPSM